MSKHKPDHYYDTLTDRRIDSMRLARAIVRSAHAERERLAAIAKPDARERRRLEQLLIVERVILNGGKS